MFNIVVYLLCTQSAVIYNLEVYNFKMNNSTSVQVVSTYNIVIYKPNTKSQFNVIMNKTGVK